MRKKKTPCQASPKTEYLLLRYIITRTPKMYKLFSYDLRKGHYLAFIGGLVGILAILHYVVEIISVLSTIPIEIYKITLEFLIK